MITTRTPSSIASTDRLMKFSAVYSLRYPKFALLLADNMLLISSAFLFIGKWQKYPGRFSSWTWDVTHDYGSLNWPSGANPPNVPLCIFRTCVYLFLKE